VFLSFTFLLSNYLEMNELGCCSGEMFIVWLESWKRKELRLLSEHNEQMSQLSDQLNERDLQIKQYESDLQV